MTHGGYRPGSGRKPGNPKDRKQPIAIKVTPELRAYLRSRKNATETIELALTRSRAFKAWKAKQ